MSNVTIEQREICVRFGSDAVPCDAAMKVGVALGTLDRAPLNALRHPGERDATGWYVWGGEYSTASDFFQPVHAEHLHSELPNLVPYLRVSTRVARFACARSDRCLARPSVTRSLKSCYP